MVSDPSSRLIACLESARKRPAMFFGAVAVEPAVHWLHGFETAAMSLLGIRDPHLEVRQAVLESRGWEFTARHPSSDMIERGLSPGEIIDELLSIEVEILRRLAEDRP